jgi:hypothetical protein
MDRRDRQVWPPPGPRWSAQPTPCAARRTLCLHRFPAAFFEGRHFDADEAPEALARSRSSTGGHGSAGLQISDATRGCTCLSATILGRDVVATAQADVAREPAL